MKQTIEIEVDVPEGKKALWKDGKIVYEDIAPKLPDSWEEFCKLYPVKGEEVFIDADSKFIYNDGNRHRSADRNMLPSLKAAKEHLSLIQLHQLRDCYRQGWVPDWNDSSSKYCITFWGGAEGYSISMYSANRYFLSFQSREVAEKFLENFKDLIDQAGDLV